MIAIRHTRFIMIGTARRKTRSPQQAHAVRMHRAGIHAGEDPPALPLAIRVRRPVGGFIAGPSPPGYTRGRRGTELPGTRAPHWHQQHGAADRHDRSVCRRAEDLRCRASAGVRGRSDDVGGASGARAVWHDAVRIAGELQKPALPPGLLELRFDDQVSV
jgi:hypothetical protein